MHAEGGKMGGGRANHQSESGEETEDGAKKRERERVDFARRRRWTALARVGRKTSGHYVRARKACANVHVAEFLEGVFHHASMRGPKKTREPRSRERGRILWGRVQNIQYGG